MLVCFGCVYVVVAVFTCCCCLLLFFVVFCCSLLFFLSYGVPLQLTEEQLEKERSKIGSWIKKGTATYSITQWRQDLKDKFVLQTLLKTRRWQEILESVAEQLKDRCKECPITCKEIDDAVEKYSHKSPREDFLKEKAYHWLKYLQAKSGTLPSGNDIQE